VLTRSLACRCLENLSTYSAASSSSSSPCSSWYVFPPDVCLPLGQPLLTAHDAR
jgi:hypothetical protein